MIERKLVIVISVIVSLLVIIIHFSNLYFDILKVSPSVRGVNPYIYMQERIFEIGRI